ncbi:hypothetical protein ADICYQ_1673 [Cyclobacterium qasimii M12-11B]|uniref:Uncharacterized protein n=1 Tax=Cyclobacterium qasimii M12-11B TaxID=641524 RepID=S7VH71_9BACT|nr:hypothetical protein ADICYQ_1673 [Cyclobacterium qasimii M12-11B]
MFDPGKVFFKNAVMVNMRAFCHYSIFIFINTYFAGITDKNSPFITFYTLKSYFLYSLNGKI